jgi:VWFA-related protein
MRRLLSAATALLLLAASARAGEAGSSRDLPVIRISTTLIQIDAVVTDRHGRPVADLGPEDFVLTQGGKRRPLTHVVYVDEPLLAEQQARPKPEDAVKPEQPTTLVFAIDDLGTSFGGIDEIRRALDKFADSIGERQVLVWETSGRAPIRVCFGPAELRAAAASLRYNLWSRGAYALEAGRFGAPGSWGRGGLDSGAYLRSLSERDSVQALEQIVNALRGQPARKVVVLFSEGFLIEPGFGGLWSSALDAAGDPDDLRRTLRGLSDLANRASTVINTVDPRGLVTVGLPAEGSADRTQALLASQGSLTELAEQTGGISVDNTNDLAGGLERVLVGSSGYYLLGYEPDSSTFEGRHPSFHEIKVKVTRHGLHVRSRKGFYGVTDAVVAQTLPAPSL